MISAPIRVPMIVPRPPNRLVPPITTAVIADSSYITPAVGSAAFTRAMNSSPARPARPPDSMYSLILCHSTCTPVTRAAVSLSPITRA